MEDILEEAELVDPRIQTHQIVAPAMILVAQIEDHQIATVVTIKTFFIYYFLEILV